MKISEVAAAAVLRARALIDAGVAVADIHRPDAVERSISLLDDRFASDVAVGDGELALGGPAGTDVLLDLREPVDAARDTYSWQKARTEPVTERALRALRQLTIGRELNAELADDEKSWLDAELR